MIQLMGLTILPSIFVTHFILSIALIKGDICPGQRGRLHQAFFYLSLVSLFTAFLYPLFIIPIILMGLFFVKNKTNKTKITQWCLLLHLTSLSYAIIIFYSLSSLSIYVFFFLLFQGVCIGSIHANLLLKIARSRLEAFNRILPFIGIISTFLMIIQVAIIHQYDFTLNAHLYSIFSAMLLYIIGVFIWIYRFIKVQPANSSHFLVCLSIFYIASYLLNFSIYTP